MNIDHIIVDISQYYVVRDAVFTRNAHCPIAIDVNEYLPFSIRVLVGILHTNHLLKLRQKILLIEVEESVLIWSNLMDINLVEACIYEFLNSRKMVLTRFDGG